VNLLPVQHKASRNPGDSREMVLARREFLDAGHYQPLREEMLSLLAPLGGGCLVDLGCGEGYYTSALPSAARSVVGVDIAKPAIQVAARRYKEVAWIVAGNTRLPLADRSVDIVTALFTRVHVPEIRRVLRVGGHLLIATPAPDHLMALRRELFEDVREHAPDATIADFIGWFDLLERREVRFDFHLNQSDVARLLLMTPYAWKAPKERRERLETRESIEVQAAFVIFCLRKRDA
jgi:23S rRNA (guanine745-N1)-methyltransferase